MVQKRRFMWNSTQSWKMHKNGEIVQLVSILRCIRSVFQIVFNNLSNGRVFLTHAIKNKAI